MPKSGIRSLLGGRNTKPLTETEIRRATNTFLGFDDSVPARHESGSRTMFRVSMDESGQEYGEIIFGADLYPGHSVLDPNAALGLDAAVAHELTHYHRWKDKTELSANHLRHIDEALTSLQATLRYGERLKPADIRQLVADATQRLQLFVQDSEEGDRL